MSDLVFALATAPGRAALAIVRASGAGAGEALSRIVGRRLRPREATLRRMVDPSTGETFDQGLALWFPAPNSFTGEDAFELHLHGGAATVEAATAALLGSGARLAEPGEFSRRAFLAGKLSLTQAEAVADLVNAETEAQRRQALQQLGGALDVRHQAWRAQLIEIAGLLEAQVDFPDEDLPEMLGRVEALIKRLIAGLAVQEGEHRGERVRDGFRIALIGAPNAGKSSLMNALLRRDAAIVTDIPGTTRDVIEAILVLDGYKVLLADTAGLRDSDDPIEQEGVRRARSWAEGADLRLRVIDSSSPDGAVLVSEAAPGDWIVLTKIDVENTSSLNQGERSGRDVLRVSVLRPGTVEALEAALESHVKARLSGADFPAVTRVRHRRALEQARQSLEDAIMSLKVGPELAAEDLRSASRSLAGITGAVGVEDVLGEVFASFCIGK